MSSPQLTTALERLNAAQARRIQQALDAAAQPPNLPALAAPGGQVQRLGGEPLQPRARQATGMVPVGAAVQVNQGIVAGQPFQPTPPPPEVIDRNVALLVVGNPNDQGGAAVQPRARVDFAISTDTGTLWRWVVADGEWVPVARALQERTVGIRGPVVGDVYPVKAVAEARYLLVSLSVRNTTATGASATAGSATVLVNGAAATMGTTVVEPDDYVGLRVDGAGGGVWLSASIVAGLA